MKVIEKIKEAKTSIVAGANGLAMAILASPAVHASNGAANAKMTAVLDQIIPYVGAIGIPIACVGAFKLIMAFRNDQGDAVPAAARDLAIGVVLILFSAIWGAVSPVLTS